MVFSIFKKNYRVYPKRSMSFGARQNKLAKKVSPRGLTYEFRMSILVNARLREQHLPATPRTKTNQ